MGQWIEIILVVIIVVLTPTGFEDIRGGFLGGALCRHLLAEGQPVIALGRNQAKLAALDALGARCIVNDLAEGTPPLPDTIVSNISSIAERDRFIPDKSSGYFFLSKKSRHLAVRN